MRERGGGGVTGGGVMEVGKGMRGCGCYWRSCLHHVMCRREEGEERRRGVSGEREGGKERE